MQVDEHTSSSESVHYEHDKASSTSDYSNHLHAAKTTVAVILGQAYSLFLVETGSDCNA